jgi:maltose alpha-D-glucosyltransferase/alpha-amylase
VVGVQAEGTAAPYFIPLTLAYEDTEESRWSRLQGAAIARVRQQAAVGVLADAFADESFCRQVIRAIEAREEVPLQHGIIRFRPTLALADLLGEADAELSLGPAPAQGTNTSVRLGERLFLKGYRRLQPGVNPELEIGRFLTEVAHFPNIVPIAGSAEYFDADGTPHAVLLLQAWIQNQGDGWNYTVNYLVRYIEDRRTTPGADPSHGLYLEFARTLGKRTAELHRALALPSVDPAFGAERITSEDLASWHARVREEALRTLAQAEASAGTTETVRAACERLLAHRDALLARIDALAPRELSGLKTRQHGDLHLGQVLLRRDDVMFVDFEGEPARPLAERRAKHSPLRDAAGMMRSFTYARHTALRRVPSEPADDLPRWGQLLASWESDARHAFLLAYDEAARDGGLYEALEENRGLLALFELEKALYEVRYELANRPDWAWIPVTSLLEGIA